MNREYFVIGILILLCLALWFLQQYLVNNLYINSINLDKTEQNITTFKHKNMSLKDELLEKESYREIEEKAKLSGFVPATFVTP